MTERPSGLPSPEQVLELLGDEFARAGYEIEDVSVDARSRPPRIRVTADGDIPLDLDTIASLSRSASVSLDALGSGAGAYVLEVTSPGIDRPLTQEKHFRRARGRKVEIHLNDGAALTGRIGAVADGAAELVVREGRGWARRSIPLTDIAKAIVQVEFSPPNTEELELAGASIEVAHMEVQS